MFAPKPATYFVAGLHINYFYGGDYMRIFKIQCDQYEYAVLCERFYLIRKENGYYKLKEVAYRKLQELMLKEIEDTFLINTFTSLLHEYYIEKLQDLGIIDIDTNESFSYLRNYYEELLLTNSLTLDF